MGSVEVFTKARMLAIENSTVVSGLVDGNGELILYTRDDTPINAGSVIGPQGDSTYLPRDPLRYIPSAPYSEYPLGNSVTFLDPNVGWPSSTLYGTLVTNRSFSSGGGTIQYWTSYTIGDDRIFYRQWFYQATDWSAWKALNADASIAVKGLVELATDAETITGTDSTRAVTPAGFSAGLAPTNEKVTSIENLLDGTDTAAVTAMKAALGIPFAEASGIVSVPAGSSSAGGTNTYSNVSITYPVGKFTVPPVVTLGATAGSGRISTAGFQAPNGTETGIAARVICFANSVVAGAELHWSAKQMTETSAEG